ncbi:unnamed protein product [Somion occarium]|uniref:Uncharacterized protein n=1 Tax=Somion occarium TaxID=3059160 RepID=A0ABP1D9V6_9APHY
MSTFDHNIATTSESSSSTVTSSPVFGYASDRTDHLRAGVVVSTTTIFPSTSPTTTLVFGEPPAPVPIGAIVGGTIAGVVLAVGVVVTWVWWGRCIKREKHKEKRELLRVLEVRENTRRNASTSGTGAPLGHSPASTLSKQKRTVKFGDEPPPLPSPKPSTSGDATITSRTKTPTSTTASSSLTTPYAPPKPSPLARALSTSSTKTSPPDTTITPLPPKPVTRIHLPIVDSRPVSSTLSSNSFYSIQSMDEPQPRIPSGLINAALSPPEPSKKFSFLNYLPPSRLRDVTAR